ncbi:N-acetylmuramoyl-L-alanine amidase [Candidatus Pacearchaeota archaeon]|nr:N-acetylmuramoyl-L-alanine amidase [Candidatus Pacearchaeota archaeon]
MQLLKKIKFIAVHHSQRKIDSLKRIKDLHINKYGWEDIGYHYLIDKKGKIQKGRNEKFIGAHVFGHNKNSLGICLIGNFDEEKPAKKQIQTLLKFLKNKIKKHHLNKKNILGHREFSGAAKTCPGKFIDMNKVREMF